MAYVTGTNNHVVLAINVMAHAELRGWFKIDPGFCLYTHGVMNGND